MRVVFFTHSLVSDWNNGNAHFLRGVCTELMAQGHVVDVYEPASGWSVSNLLAEHGERPLRGFARAYPGLCSRSYTLDTLNLDDAVGSVDLVLVHEWSEPALVKKLGLYRRDNPSLRLLFHDTHHRCVTDSKAMAHYDLRHYDGVLAFGSVIRDRYLEQGWAKRAWTWHEAADVRLFKPMPGHTREGDLVWIGNWGDEERTAELQEFLLDPVAAMQLRARVYGVRYPEHALSRLADAGIAYGGWLPNYEAPEVFARYAVTVHVPRRPYVEALPGIPTIRVFEALACGIPLVSAPWVDSEGLFEAGADYLGAADGKQMRSHLRDVLNDPALASTLAQQGRRTILARHTCEHRVDELLGIYTELAPVQQSREVNI